MYDNNKKFGRSHSNNNSNPSRNNYGNKSKDNSNFREKNNGGRTYRDNSNQRAGSKEESVDPIISKNMNYVYNVEYFDHIRKETKETKETNDKKDTVKFILGKNSKVDQFVFTQKASQIPGNCSFVLKTCYPGLLMGTGYEHAINAEDAFMCGFSFDFVTGLPYLPGSSLKGILRNCFPSGKEDDPKTASKVAMIKGLLEKSELSEEQILKLKDSIFDNNDIFYDVYPEMKETGEKLIAEEYVTPHTKGIFANPIPIKLIKVKPGVTFRFSFELHDYEDESGLKVSSDEKKELFMKLVKLMGIGAKTNVGFGKME